MTSDSDLTQLTRRGTLQATAGLATIGLFASSVSAETVGGDGDYTAAPSDLAATHSGMAGSGTADDPYQVTNPHELQAISQDMAGHYVLQNNLDMAGTTEWNSGSGFASIGDDSTNFTGSFDGNGYTIQNLYINRPSTYHIGLFGYLGTGAAITAVGLPNVDMTGDTRTGSVVGMNDGGDVSNAYATGAVSGGTHTGGLMGRNLAGTITACFAAASVSGDPSYEGGLVGGNGGTVTDSYWDTEASTLSTSPAGTGLTTSEMQGDAAESNMSGFDFVDVWATVSGGYPRLRPPEPPTYAVTVTVEDESGAAVEGATVTLAATDMSTDSSGQVAYDIGDGEHSYTVTADGYEDISGTVTVSGAAVSETVVLTEAPTDTTVDTIDSSTADTEGGLWDRLFGTSDSEGGFWNRLFGSSSSDDGSEGSFLDSLFKALGLR